MCACVRVCLSVRPSVCACTHMSTAVCHQKPQQLITPPPSPPPNAPCSSSLTVRSASRSALNFCRRFALLSAVAAVRLVESSCLAGKPKQKAWRNKIKSEKQKEQGARTRREGQNNGKANGKTAKETRAEKQTDHFITTTSPPSLGARCEWYVWPVCTCLISDPLQLGFRVCQAHLKQPWLHREEKTNGG